MYVEFKDADSKILGVAELTKRGDVRFRAPFAEKIRKTTIVEPGTLEKLTPGDGERYLRALPFTFRPPYFWAKVVEDDGE